MFKKRYTPVAGQNHPWELSGLEQRLMPELNRNLDKKKMKTILSNGLNSSENPDDRLKGNKGKNYLLKQIIIMNMKIQNQENGFSENEVRTGRTEN